MSKPSDAIKYAEETLGVHSVHEQALAARNQLDEVLTELGNKRDSLRDKEWALQDREMEVAGDERGRHPDMSATGMEKHLKIALQNDDATRELREQISHIRSDIEGLEYDRSIAEHDIKIACARMNELTGYFQYLAIVKDVANRRQDAGTVASAPVSS
jgi:hypothetical protein